MKFLIISALILFSAVNASAQKFLDGDRVLMEYTEFPEDYTLQDYKTYYFDYEGLSNYELIEELAIMPGFNRVVDKNDADFTLAVTQHELSNTNPSRKAVKKTKTKKDGTKVNYTDYSFSSTIKAIYTTEIRLPNGSVIASTDEQMVKSFETAFYDDERRAEGEFSKRLKKEKRKLAIDTFQKIFNPMRDKYCFVPHKYYCSFVGFKFKKHDYKELNTLAEKVTLILANTITNENRVEINKAIALWTAALQNFDASSPKARINEKVKAGLLFNIALSYFYLENYDNALDFSNQAFESKNSGVQGIHQIIEKVSAKNISSASISRG